MWVEFKLGRNLFVYLFGWLKFGWEKKSKRKKKKKIWERRKRKRKEKNRKVLKNKKSLNNCVNKYVCLVRNIGIWKKCNGNSVRKLLWVDHSLWIRQVFVSITFRNCPLFVYPTTIQSLKALEIHDFVFLILFLDECII